MKKVLSGIVLFSIFGMLVGCQSQSQQSYSYANAGAQAAAQQPQMVSDNVQLDAVNQNGQPTVARSCLNNAGQVVADQYCDPNWIAQQQAIAQAQHNQQMLNDLLLYHFMFGGSYSNNVYIGGSRYLPSGYGYMPYSSYRTYVVQHPTMVVHQRITVVNHTVVVNHPAQTYTTAASRVSTPSAKPTQTFTPASTAATAARTSAFTSSWASKPSTPSPSTTASRTSAFTSGWSSPSRSSSSSFSSSSSRSFGKR